MSSFSLEQHTHPFHTTPGLEERPRKCSVPNKPHAVPLIASYRNESPVFISQMVEEALSGHLIQNKLRWLPHPRHTSGGRHKLAGEQLNAWQ